MLASPWWVSAVMGVGVYFFLRWIIPALFAGNPILVSLSRLSQSLAWLAFPIFGLIAFIAFIGKKKTAVRTEQRPRKEPTASRQKPIPVSALDQAWGNHAQASSLHQTGDTAVIPAWSLSSLRSLEWKRFELLCAKYYETLNFKAVTQASGPDGGIDVRLYRSDLTHPIAIVQCKAWNSKANGVRELRELLGVMVHEKVERGIFITSGSYTSEALEFGSSNPIQLLDGEAFLQRILQLDSTHQDALAKFAFSGDYRTPSCPSCGIKMIVKEHQNNHFWKCLNYPRCRNTFKIKKTTIGM
ncbi:restriction endonuclease [Herminiimonas sp. KBW02]|uniref:restriction endonuclease n=1 Tax=Herminiimonas sp. KBW02 TaxID=2153363 RepID=UPI00131584F9|nr:restriction endonuclease [Herminiimonas sp. KBW02]